MFPPSLSSPSWKFGLDESVAIAVSGEEGLVIGRAEFLASENSYLIRYKASDGRAVEAWWSENALVSGPPRVDPPRIAA